MTVQGTEEVYETTRTKMKQAERQRKEPRAQEIKLPSKGYVATGCVLVPLSCLILLCLYSPVKSKENLTSK